jgi:hypothetical protein
LKSRSIKKTENPKAETDRKTAPVKTQYYIKRKEHLMINEGRKIPIQVYLTEEENELLQEKMKLANIKNKSEYVRRMITDGYILEVNFPELKEYNFLLSKVSTNVNQIAHRINETRSIYKTDIDELKKEIDKIWQLQKSMLSMLPSEGQ